MPPSQFFRSSTHDTDPRSNMPCVALRDLRLLASLMYPLSKEAMKHKRPQRHYLIRQVHQFLSIAITKGFGEAPSLEMTQVTIPDPGIVQSGCRCCKSASFAAPYSIRRTAMTNRAVASTVSVSAPPTAESILLTAYPGDACAANASDQCTVCACAISRCIETSESCVTAPRLHSHCTIVLKSRSLIPILLRFARGQLVRQIAPLQSRLAGQPRP